MKPLIKWGGGKRKEIKMFEDYIPSNFDTYIEPFVGGGALYFHLNFDGNNIINDTHPDLINFYQTIKDNYSDKIYELMSKYDNNEETYYYIRDIFVPQDTIEEAFVFFYLRKTCYRGMLRYNKKGHFNIPFGRYKTYNFDILKDNRYTELLERTTIYNKSFEYVFDNYNNSYNFVFLDPPYDSKFSNYGFGNFDEKDHMKLAEYFKSTNNKCLMIIGESSLINELYSGYIKDKFHKKYAFKLHSERISDDIDNNHLIITNY